MMPALPWYFGPDVEHLEQMGIRFFFLCYHALSKRVRLSGLWAVVL